MEYILFLNRFELDKDKLKNKIIKLDNSVSFLDGEKVIAVDSKLDAEEFMKFHEVKYVVVLFKNWKNFSFKDLKEDCLQLCGNFNVKRYFVELKFWDKVKISARSLYRHINPYLKHEGILVNETDGDILYIDIRKIDGKLKYRISYSNQKLYNRQNIVKVDMNKFIVVMEEPTYLGEIDDFLRLCWVFGLPLHIVTKNKGECEKLFNKAKEISKGIDYTKFDIKISNDFPSGYTLVGFSKHSDKNEKDMKVVLLTDKKIALVFGDDKFGLSQEARDKLDYCFRLTPSLKKPLRASQALSYVLGFYTADNILFIII